MPAYILLSKLSSGAQKDIADDPEKLKHIRQTLEEWEANILGDYYMLGGYHHCILFEVSDNARAHRAVLQQTFTDADDTILLPAIDLDIFEALIKKEIRTEGPHDWQVQWWARLIRFCLHWYQYDRWKRRYFKPFIVTGAENFDRVKGPCIIVANHTSHLDTFALLGALPLKIRSNIYMGAAADRWFLRKGGGRKKLALQPWYNSLVGGCFPIRRGGGSATLDYSKWLLDQGANLGIFPEGTRSTSRHMARFKHGVSLLALEKAVPVVPIYLYGVSKIRPKGAREVTPGLVYAHVQQPIEIPPGTAVPQATKMIHERLNAPHLRCREHGVEAGRYDFKD